MVSVAPEEIAVNLAKELRRILMAIIQRTSQILTSNHQATGLGLRAGSNMRTNVSLLPIKMPQLQVMRT